MKILILEDNEELAQMLTKLLECHGHTVSHVLNGSLGLERIETGDFDLIVSDVNMPIMDGLTFAVTARNRGLKAPIMLFTGEPYLDPTKLNGAQITAVFGKCESEAMIKTINGMELNQ